MEAYLNQVAVRMDTQMRVMTSAPVGFFAGKHIGRMVFLQAQQAALRESLRSRNVLDLIALSLDMGGISTDVSRMALELRNQHKWRGYRPRGVETVAAGGGLFAAFAMVGLVGPERGRFGPLFMAQADLDSDGCELLSATRSRELPDSGRCRCCGKSLGSMDA